jgi:hypothetical protein
MAEEYNPQMTQMKTRDEDESGQDQQDGQDKDRELFILSLILSILFLLSFSPSRLVPCLSHPRPSASSADGLLPVQGW